MGPGQWGATWGNFELGGGGPMYAIVLPSFYPPGPRPRARGPPSYDVMWCVRGAAYKHVFFYRLMNSTVNESQTNRMMLLTTVSLHFVPNQLHTGKETMQNGRERNARNMFSHFTRIMPLPICETRRH